MNEYQNIGMFDSGAGIAGADMNPGGLSGTVRFGAKDEMLLVVFYNKRVEVPSQSVNAGRRIFTSQVFIRIQHPGETYNIIDRPVTDADKMRFRAKWSAFVQNRTQIPEGTDIDLLFPNYPHVSENLKGFGVYTIEQAAALSATAIDTIGRGAQEVVNKAKTYLAASDKGKAFHLMQKQIDELKGEIAVRDHQIHILKSQLDHIMLKNNDPIRGSLTPPFVRDYDPQTERINANAPTKEAAIVARKRRSKKAPVLPDVRDELTDPFKENDLNNTKEITETSGQDQN